MSRPRVSGLPPSSPAVDVVRRCLTDERGSLMMEYVVVTMVVAIASMIALLGVGLALAQNFGETRSYIMSPVP
jgi:Flp pilus assembly pilin Flp